MVMLPVAVAGSLLAHPLLALWMGSTFADQAAWPLQCCLVAFLLATSAVPWTELARGRGRAWPLVRYTVVLAGANIGLVALLTPRWGVAGAATALVTSQIIGTLTLAASSGLALRALRTAGSLLGVGAGYVLATLAVSGLSAGLAGRIAGALLLSLAYAYAAWRLGLDERERQVLRRAVAMPSP
jgi:O-antigen/teichoic acid export membrane protein